MLVKESLMYSLGNVLHHHCPILFKLCSIDDQLFRPGEPVGDKLASLKNGGKNKTNETVAAACIIHS